MSAAISGVEGNVLIGATDVDAQSWSFDFSVSTFDSTTTADLGWDDETPATKRIEGSFDFFYNTTKKPTGSLNLIPGVTVAVLSLYINKTADEKYEGKALIKKLSIKTKVKDGVVLTASFTNKGPWTFPS